MIHVCAYLNLIKIKLEDLKYVLRTSTVFKVMFSFPMDPRISLFCRDLGPEIPM